MENQQASNSPDTTPSILARSRRTTPDRAPATDAIDELPPPAVALEDLRYLEEGEQSEISKLFWMGPVWTQSDFDEHNKRTDEMIERHAREEAEMQQEIAASMEMSRQLEVQLAQLEQQARELRDQARGAQDLDAGLSDTDRLRLGSLMESMLSENLSGQYAPVCELQSVMALYGVYLELVLDDGVYLGFEDFCTMFDIQWY